METKVVKIGDRIIGGNNPILIQSMTNTKTEDITATVQQINELTELGCDIIRCAVPTMEAAGALKEIKKQIRIPLVADIHFDYKLAIAAIENGADKIRINPGNIGSTERVKAVVDAAKEKGFPCHTGVVQCKDAFYGQHEPEEMPVSYELINKWEAWKRMGCLASEMESAALFIVAGKLRVRAGSCFLVVANQEREKLGLENPVVHDTDMAIRVAVEAIRKMIKEDQAK